MTRVVQTAREKRWDIRFSAASGEGGRFIQGRDDASVPFGVRISFPTRLFEARRLGMNMLSGIVMAAGGVCNPFMKSFGTPPPDVGS